MYISKKFALIGAAIIGVIVIMFAFTNNGDSVQNGNIVDRRGDSEALGLKMPDGSSGDSAPDIGTSSYQDAECPQDYHVDNGEEFNVPAGCQIKGDVIVNGEQLFDNDANTGLIVSCPQGCQIKAPWGANVTPRDVDDLKEEMLSSGCGMTSGCNDVKIVVIDQDGKGGEEPSSTPSATPTATSTPEPTSTQPIDDGCEPELKLGEKRMIAKGCIVVGDVFVRPAGSDGEFRPVFDNRKDTGTVHLLTEDTEVWNLQGASIMPAGMELADIVTATKLAGCGTGYGCPEGIYDWDGNRLDVVN